MAKKTLTGFQEGLSGLISSNMGNTGNEGKKEERKTVKGRTPVIQKADSQASEEEKSELIGIFEESKNLKVNGGTMCLVDEEYMRILLRAAGSAGIKIQRKQIVNTILREFIRKYKGEIQELISLESNNIDNI